MNVLLLQHDPCIKDLSRSVMKKYPNSSVIETSGFTFPTKRPVLSNKWLVRVQLKRNAAKQILSATKSQEVANFIFVSSGHVETIEPLLRENEIEYQVADNLRPAIDTMVNYVQRELDLSNSLAQRVVDKSNRYEPLVLKNVQLLALLRGRVLTSTEIDKYLQDDSGISFNYLYNYILKGEGEYKKIVRLVFRYQNAPYVLSKFLLKRLNADIDLFNLILSGDLHRSNLNDYVRENRISLYPAQQALDLFENVTLETLHAKRILYQSLLGNNCVEFLLKGCKR